MPPTTPFSNYACFERIPGYEVISWGQVRVGQPVWIYGITRDQRGSQIRVAYGPHTVHNIQQRQLRDRNGYYNSVSEFLLIEATPLWIT